MSLTLDAELSGEFSNSYVTLDYADDYWADHFSSTQVSAWAALSDEAKTTLLILGCRNIEKYKFTQRAELGGVERLYFDDVRNAIRAYNEGNFDPYKYSSTQLLQFPRSIDVDTAGDTFIPEAIQIAQCEQALYIKDLDQTAITKALVGITAETVSLGKGQIYRSTKYASGKDGSGLAAMTQLAPRALELISPYCLRNKKLRRA